MMRFWLFLIILLMPSLAWSDTCYLIARGELILDQSPCDVTRDHDGVTVEQGNYITINIKNGVIRTNIFNPPHNGPDDLNAYKMHDLGPALTKTSGGNTCYQNAVIALCLGK